MKKLNSIGGNSIAWMANKDRENAASHTDTYKCDCGNICQEHEFIHELKICKECFEEHYGSSHISVDQAEYLKGDR